MTARYAVASVTPNIENLLVSFNYNATRYLEERSACQRPSSAEYKTRVEREILAPNTILTTLNKNVVILPC